jgi:beta-mannosidase
MDFDKRRLVFSAEIEVHDKIIAKNLLYFEKPKNLLLPAVDPEIQVEKIEGGYRIIISSKHLTKNLSLEYPGVDGYFDQNFFDVLPGEKIETVFETKSVIADQNLKPVIRCLNMINSVSGKK